MVDFFQFEAFNPRGHFVRHRAFLGELTRKDEIVDDFAFSLVRRGQQSLVSLRSRNFPKRFLRHRDFRIRLEEPVGSGDQPFARDSTFFIEPGLADPKGVSFRSFNLRDHFIAHRGFQLFIAREDTPNLAQHATFFQTRAPVIIDHGADLNPV
ncbi:MAG TPA: AbfB domain-containing protein [Solirubrobacteraceae bacterium]|nr:AbfB domain-containing protein [Solirubrobacteraceae bacterium]